MLCNRCSKTMKPFDDSGIRTWNCPSCYLHHDGVESRNAEQITIDKDVAEFLARGGKVHKVDYTENRSFKDPIKRTRKDQINTLRNRDLG